MGLEERAATFDNDGPSGNCEQTICKHGFDDLSHISPLVFVYLLKECYFIGACKATKKFRVLQKQVHLVLRNNPQPGPATFVVQCLYVLPIFDLYCEGFSHLIISALRRFLKLESSSGDNSEAKVLAAKLYLDIVGGSVNHDDRIIEKILEVFDVQLENIQKAMCPSLMYDDSFSQATKFVEDYIYHLIGCQNYMTAVTLMAHFSIRHSGKSFLLSLIESKQLKAAEKWATFIGKSMLCDLVQEYTDRNMLKDAYEIIHKNNLRQEFPIVCHKYKESSLKQLAEKGCWDVAEAKTKSDRQLLEYLVYLAMEAGYSEKVDELCNRYSLKGFENVKVPDPSILHNRYLHLDELAVEGVIWVDEVDALHKATCHFEKCKVVGLDCEWKPNYVKGSKPNKVSIMQIASDKKVFILDLIKLYQDAPAVLEDCLTRVFQSPGILKLGYNFQCDMRQLAQSYEDLKCFRHYQMLLDIQSVFKEPNGGLSGLVKKILGVGLNKTRRNSNWEQRPLTPNQLEYAALDAAVLVHIFCHLRTHSPSPDGEGHGKLEWKSCIVSNMTNTKKFKKGSAKESPEAQALQFSLL